jgi:F0F1-type ATP synthase membrane subunit b/b'
MGILVQLGINHTYFYQLIIFVFALLVLSQFVFKDFVELLEKREEKTKGSEEIASDFKKKAQELHTNYEIRAKSINNEIKTIYDSYRADASKEYDAILSKARAESAKVIEKNRIKITSEIAEASIKITEEAPIIAAAISNKLLQNSDKKANA